MDKLKFKIGEFQRIQMYMRTDQGRYKRALIKVRNRGIKWEIPLDEYAKLITKPCCYCGSLPFGCGIGLDRIDNDGPYSLDNVMPCCYTCNVLRGALNKALFVDTIIKIYNNLSGNIRRKGTKARVPKSKK